MTNQNYDSEKQYYIYQKEICVLEHCIYSSALIIILVEFTYFYPFDIFNTAQAFEYQAHLMYDVCIVCSTSSSLPAGCIVGALYH